MLIGASIISYFHVTKDYIHLAKITKYVLIFIGITSVLTIIFYTTVVETEDRLRWTEWNDQASKYGYAAYRMAIVLMSLIPILMFFIKNQIKSGYRNIWILFLLVILFAIFRIQLFTNILFALTYTYIG